MVRVYGYVLGLYTCNASSSARRAALCTAVSPSLLR